MIKVVNIVGARPQFVKYFPISTAINKYNESNRDTFQDILIHTGQHYEYKMSKLFFDDFGIREPDYHLGVGSGSHGKQTGQVIERVEKVLIKESPEVVLLYGDTNSTLGGAIAASKLHIPIAHVEAGLRSFNKYMPEEINRILVDHVSTFLLCPSKTAVNNLSSEGYNNIASDGDICDSGFNVNSFYNQPCGVDKNISIVINVGDVMYDVLLHALEVAERKSRILNELKLGGKGYSLLTLHRAENTDNIEKLHAVIDFVNRISEGRRLIFPMHPRTKPVYKKSDRKFSSNVEIMEPIGYFDLIMLIKGSCLVLTDSGGIQKEAYWLKTPCITLREETEWTETIDSGWNVLYKDFCGRHKPTDIDGNHFGDGKTSDRVVNILKDVFIK